jgi:rubredoxin-NAD+ reductase
MKPLIILGCGLAGYTVARELRRLDNSRPVMLITRDSGDFYSKPSLSNALALKKDAASLVNSTAAAMAQQLSITLLPQVEVRRIDTRESVVETNLGRYEYGELVLALGASPIRVPLTGTGAQRVISVNNLQDYASFREQLRGARRVLIIGAGLIGCEFANDLAHAGVEPIVVDPGTHALSALLPRVAGERLGAALSNAGVIWRFGATVVSVDDEGGSLRATLSAGENLTVDAVLSAVGLRPNIGLAQEAGLRVGRGIKVDAYGRTNTSNVFAIGDCAEYEQGVLPFVMPIMTAAKSIAATLAGTPTPIKFAPMPVAVKTPAHPVVAHVPKGIVDTAWDVEVVEDGVRLLLRNTEGAMTGFIATGSFAAQRAALVRQLLAQ